MYVHLSASQMHICSQHNVSVSEIICVLQIAAVLLRKIGRHCQYSIEGCLHTRSTDVCTDVSLSVGFLDY